MEIVDDSAPAQIKEIFAQSLIACASPLPSTDMGEDMFDCHPFAQFVTTFWGLLA